MVDWITGVRTPRIHPLIYQHIMRNPHFTFEWLDELDIPMNSVVWNTISDNLFNYHPIFDNGYVLK
jgi:hypothetical protein